MLFCWHMTTTSQIVSLLIEERSKIQAAIDALKTTPEPGLPEWVGRPAPKNRLTPEGKQSQSEKMKAYWAAKRTAKAATVAPKKKYKLGAEARQRMAEGQRKRWADIKEMGNEAGHGKKKSAKAAIAEAIAPKEDADFKSKMSIAMAKSWAKRKA